MFHVSSFDTLLWVVFTLLTSIDICDIVNKLFLLISDINYEQILIMKWYHAYRNDLILQFQMSMII